MGQGKGRDRAIRWSCSDFINDPSTAGQGQPVLSMISEKGQVVLPAVGCRGEQVGWRWLSSSHEIGGPKSLYFGIQTDRPGTG